MSCFESSTFLKNPNIMDQAILKEACEQLGWPYTLKNKALTILNVKPAVKLRGEFALKVVDNTVTYNRYYLKNGKQLIQKLLEQFHILNVAYAKKSILQAFEKVGFRLRRDWDFKPTQEIVDKFFMVAATQLAGEEEKETIIQFSILKDGTVISDSNYLPHDVHELADQAMEALDKSFGTTRREGYEIQRKPIPPQYKGKTYCTLSGQIKAKQDNSNSNKIILKN